MNNSPRGTWDDDHDDDRFDEQSVFEAFAAYKYSDIELGWEPSQSNVADQLVTVAFTARNPEDTVSVTALMDGQVLRIGLGYGVAAMTESELGEEIRVIAHLASRQALAGQHLVTAALMNRLGHDPANTRSFLERELRLPSPDVVLAERAQLFAERYAPRAEDMS